MVTGSSRGFGRATAYSYALKGAKVIIAPRTVKELKALEESMHAEAFTDAWTFLALQISKGVTGQRLGAHQLAEYLRLNGWEVAVAMESKANQSCLCSI